MFAEGLLPHAYLWRGFDIGACGDVLTCPACVSLLSSGFLNERCFLGEVTISRLVGCPPSSGRPKCDRREPRTAPYASLSETLWPLNALESFRRPLSRGVPLTFHPLSQPSCHARMAFCLTACCLWKGEKGSRRFRGAAAEPGKLFILSAIGSSTVFQVVLFVYPHYASVFKMSSCSFKRWRRIEEEWLVIRLCRHFCLATSVSEIIVRCSLTLRTYERENIGGTNGNLEQRHGMYSAPPIELRLSMNQSDPVVNPSLS